MSKNLNFWQLNKVQIKTKVVQYEKPKKKSQLNKTFMRHAVNRIQNFVVFIFMAYSFVADGRWQHGTHVFDRAHAKSSVARCCVCVCVKKKTAFPAVATDRLQLS